MRTPMIVVAFVLLGCGHATGYMAASPASYGFGYSETRLSEASFQVVYAGNVSTKLQQAVDFAVLRGADLTLQNGYRSFSVVAESASWRALGEGFSSSPTAVVTIVCYRETQTPTAVIGFDAAEVSRHIRATYDLSAGAPDRLDASSSLPFGVDWKM